MGEGEKGKNEVCGEEEEVECAEEKVEGEEVEACAGEEEGAEVE